MGMDDMIEPGNSNASGAGMIRRDRTDPARDGIDPCRVTPSVAPPYHQHPDFVGRDGDPGRKNVLERRCQ